MTQISVTALKKQAKLLRKNNQNLKNHNQSLNLLSNQYGYDNWQDLIDSCYLHTAKENQPDNDNIVVNTAEINIPSFSTVNTIEQLPIEISDMLEPLNESFIDLKNEYLKFQKLKNREDGHVSAYIHDIVFDDYSGDNNLERKKVSALIEHIVGAYFIDNKKSKHIRVGHSLETLFEKHLEYDYNPRNDNFLANELTVNVDDYLNILGDGIFTKIQLHQIVSENPLMHRTLLMHLKRAIKIFKIFEEIKYLTINRNINDAIFDWLSNYNNTARLAIMAKKALSHPITLYINKIEEYDLKNNNLMHDSNISILRKNNVKIISLAIFENLNYEELFEIKQKIHNLKINTLRDLISYNTTIDIKPVFYIRNIGDSVKELNLFSDNAKNYLKSISIESRFCDIFKLSHRNKLDFYFVEK